MSSSEEEDNVQKFLERNPSLSYGAVNCILSARAIKPCAVCDDRAAEYMEDGTTYCERCLYDLKEELFAKLPPATKASICQNEAKEETERTKKRKESIRKWREFQRTNNPFKEMKK